MVQCVVVVNKTEVVVINNELSETLIGRVDGVLFWLLHSILKINALGGKDYFRLDFTNDETEARSGPWQPRQ